MDATRLISRYRSALMGFAQLWIVLLHCWLLIVPNRPVLGAIEAFIRWHGTVGVEIFFFLSGTGLTYAIRKGSLRSFYLGRLRRVLLPYWIMVFVYTVSGHHSLRWGLFRALGIHFFTRNALGLLWFIPAILILYAIFPVYHKLMMRAKDKTAFTLSAIMLWLCAIVLLRDAVREDLWVFINRLPSFLLGIWFGEMGRERTLTMRAEHWALCSFSALAGFLLIKAGNRGLVPLIPEFAFAASTLCGVPLCFLLSGLFCVLENGRFGVIFRCPVRFLSFVGTFTLELYCVHQWLYSRLYTPLEGHVSYLAINLISLPAVIAAGWLLYLVHRYLIRLIDAACGKAK